MAWSFSSARYSTKKPDGVGGFAMTTVGPVNQAVVSYRMPVDWMNRITITMGQT